MYSFRPLQDGRDGVKWSGGWQNRVGLWGGVECVCVVGGMWDVGRGRIESGG